MVCGRGPSIGKKVKQSGQDLIDEVKENPELLALGALAIPGVLPALGSAASGVGSALGGAASGVGSALGSAASGIGGALGAAGGALGGALGGLGGAAGAAGAIPELVSGAGSILGGSISGDAQEDAARIQQESAAEAIEFQREALEKLRGDLAPYRQFGESALAPLGENIGIGGDTQENELLQSAYDRQAAMDPGLSPDILQNPLLRALQDDVTRRLTANQAARGKLGSGGTAEALQQRLVPQAIQFGLQLKDLQRQDISDRMRAGLTQEDLKQRQISNLFDASRLGQASAAQAGLAGQSAASQMGNFAITGGQAGAAGALDRAQSRNQMLGGLASAGLNLLGGGGGGDDGGGFNFNFSPTTGDFIDLFGG